MSEDKDRAWRKESWLQGFEAGKLSGKNEERKNMSQEDKNSVWQRGYELGKQAPRGWNLGDQLMYGSVTVIVIGWATVVVTALTYGTHMVCG